MPAPLGDSYAAKLTSWHTASQDNNPFTVYVVTVRKDNAQWRVFRRYKEWEDLRGRLCQWCGNAPQMPGKMLFGRMRLEVIETRVLGLNNFLQQILSGSQYACADLVDFLERDRNVPPAGLDLVPDASDVPDSTSAQGDGSADGAHQAQLKRLVDAASVALISVSQDVPALDPGYLHDRAATYAATLRPSEGPLAGSVISLAAPAAAAAGVDAQGPSAAAIEAALDKMFAAPPTDPTEIDFARETAAAVSGALSSIGVQGKHDVLVSVG